MRVNPVIHFRAEPATQRLLLRLREERAVNVSAWLRQVVQQSLEKEFPDFVDYLADPAKPDPQKTPIKAVDVTDTAAEAFVEWTEDNRERSPADQDEAGRLSDVPEPDPQKTPIEGWRPRRLPGDQWGRPARGPGGRRTPRRQSAARHPDRRDRQEGRVLDHDPHGGRRKNRHHHRRQEFRPAEQLMTHTGTRGRGRPAPGPGGGGALPRSREGWLRAG